MNAETLATKRVSDVIAALSHLADVLARENRALRDHDRGALRELTEEKATAARAYEAKVEAMKEAGAALGGIDDDLRQRLAGIGERTTGLIIENERLLRIAMETGRHLMEAIVGAAKDIKDMNIGPGTYSRAGNVASGSRQATSSASLSLDRSL